MVKFQVLKDRVTHTLRDLKERMYRFYEVFMSHAWFPESVISCNIYQYKTIFKAENRNLRSSLMSHPLCVILYSLCILQLHITLGTNIHLSYFYYVLYVVPNFNILV